MARVGGSRQPLPCVILPFYLLFHPPPLGVFVGLGVLVGLGVTVGEVPPPPAGFVAPTVGLPFAAGDAMINVKKAA